MVLLLYSQVQFSLVHLGPVSSFQACMFTDDHIVNWWAGLTLDCSSHVSDVRLCHRAMENNIAPQENQQTDQKKDNYGGDLAF